VVTRKPPAAAPKKKARPAASRARAARALPPADGDAPFSELARDPLSVFLYVALTPEETRAVVKTLGLTVPGFRTEALSDVERCDVLADELRAAPAARAPVLEALRKAFGRPPLVAAPLDPDSAEDLLAVTGSEHALTLSLWRVLADPDAAVRARAVPVLEELVAQYYGPAPAEGEAGLRQVEPPPAGGGAAAEARAQELTRELARAEERSASARKKAEEQREKLQDWLREARARAAQAVDEAARAREAAEAAQRAREKAEAALAAVQATDAAADAQRARSALRDAEGRATALEARLARAAEREEALAAALRDAGARAEPRPAPGQERPAAAVEADEPEEASADWLLPVYSREFYDSLEGWDRRIQRAAFKQAHLLAQDHRHPSLRALPLEGLPGYYRVRVATDVRLLYRRGDRQNTVEILSLIDREDLDRYVRQAKTRQ
jgi:mRNA-degrading endonuclease RelE of RelBE toxin-antitoxin system